MNWIDVKIPYEPNHKLCEAYNRAMRETSAPWVLLLDQDVFLGLNPHWYEICLELVNKAPANTGLLTCVTNGCEGRAQEPDVKVDKTPNLDVHVRLAKQLYDKNGIKIRQVKNHLVAGYFMLVNRKAWEKVPFKVNGGKKYKVDQYFVERLLRANYKIYVMQGLYVYHRRDVRKLNWK